MARQPAMSTQLKAANVKIAELEKKLADCEKSKGWAQEARTDAERQVEEVHTFLDALPGAIDRKHPENYTERSPMTRLAAWFASRNA